MRARRRRGAGAGPAGADDDGRSAAPGAPFPSDEPSSDDRPADPSPSAPPPELPSPELPSDEAMAAAMRQWGWRLVAARELSRALVARRLADRARRRWPESDPATIAALAAAAADGLVGVGLVDDGRYAELSVRAGSGRGRSRRRIAADLEAAGVAAAAALAEVDEVANALRLLRRRRLGPWDPAATSAGDPDAGTADDPDAGAAGDPDAGAAGHRAGRSRWRAVTPADRAMALLMRHGFSSAARAALALDRDEAEARLA